MNEPPRSNLDPKNVNGRLYNQLATLLDEIEQSGDEISMRERLAAIIAIGRIQVMFMGLRKEGDHDVGTGSSVRKYSTAFKNAASRRKAAARSAAPSDEFAGPAGDPGDDDWGDSA